MPEGGNRGEVGSVGIKTGRKRMEIERGSFAPPSITFLEFKFIWLHFSLKYTAHRREGGGGGGGGGKQYAGEWGTTCE